MKRTALVTGVTGFIGGRLSKRLLADGWTLHALVREGSVLPDLPGACFHGHDGSVEGLTQILRAAAPDVVFHLASLYLADHQPAQVDGLVTSNVLLTAQLAEAMCAAGASRLINTGTSWQHFGTDTYLPVNLYAATKQAGLDILAYYADARLLSVVTLKLFDTFGPGDTRRKLVQLLVDAAVSGETLGMSPGYQVVDLTHIDDVTNAFIAAAEVLLAAKEPVFEEYFVSGLRLSVRELVSKVEEALRLTVNTSFGARPYRAREVMVPVAIDLQQRLPGWVPEREFTQSLRELAQSREVTSGSA